LGNPVRIRLTPGQTADVTQGPILLEGLEFEAVIADKGYDREAFVKGIEQPRGEEGKTAQAVIPPRTNKKVQRDYDKHLYKARNLVERFIGYVKQYRRVATRYEKTARNYLAFWHFASIQILLR
jgi:transposase